MDGVLLAEGADVAHRLLHRAPVAQRLKRGVGPDPLFSS